MPTDLYSQNCHSLILTVHSKETSRKQFQKTADFGLKIQQTNLTLNRTISCIFESEKTGSWAVTEALTTTTIPLESTSGRQLIRLTGRHSGTIKNHTRLNNQPHYF